MLTTEIFKNIIKNKFLRNITILITVLFLTVPYFTFQQITKSFSNQIMFNIKEEAKKVAYHVYNRHVNKHSSENNLTHMKDIIKELDIDEIKH